MSGKVAALMDFHSWTVVVTVLYLGLFNFYTCTYIPSAGSSSNRYLVGKLHYHAPGLCSTFSLRMSIKCREFVQPQYIYVDVV